jgi:transposase InsO family protein
LGGQRGRLIPALERCKGIALIKEASLAGARRHKSCEILGLTVRTLERWEKEEGQHDKRHLVHRVPANKLTKEQRSMVLATVNSAPYQHLPPSKIVPLLADLGCYLASESTFYRILRAAQQLKHRLISRPATHKRPEAYAAHGANQVWSWDISYLPTQVRGIYFYLYFIMDIYSRKIVGWRIHECESSEHAAMLMKQSCLDEDVQPEQLVLHSDNGAPMKGLTMLMMLQELGVIPSFSRPSVSDDNPYSEALFKTAKYHHSFPRLNKFATILNARIWGEQLVNWYNNEHLHSALKFVTPHQRHSGEDNVIRIKRHAVYQIAQQEHPERWSGKTRNWLINKIATLNPNKKLKEIKKENSNIISMIA